MNPSQMPMNPMGMPQQMNNGMMPQGGQMNPQGMMQHQHYQNNGQRNMQQNNMNNRGGNRGNGGQNGGYKGANQRDNYGGQGGNNRFGGNNQYVGSGSGKFNGQHQQQKGQNNAPPMVKRPIQNNHRSGPGGRPGGPNGQPPRRDIRGPKNEGQDNQNYHNNQQGFQGGSRGPKKPSSTSGGQKNKNHSHKQDINSNKLSVTAFHKTKMCPTVEAGQQCKKGDKCGYAHTQVELREPPNLKKTKLCQLFKMTRCNKGDQCDFAHGNEELKSYVDRYKTQICQQFTKTGTCQNGDKCHYAHGEQEIRQPQFYNDTLNQSIQPGTHMTQPQQVPQGQVGQIQGGQPQSSQGAHMGLAHQQQGQQVAGTTAAYQQQMNPSQIPYGYTDQSGLYANNTQYVQYAQQGTATTAYGQAQPVQQALYTQPLPQTQVYTQSYPTSTLQQYTTQQPIQYFQQPQQYQSYV